MNAHPHSRRPPRQSVARSAQPPPLDSALFRFLCAATIMALGCAAAASARAEAVVVSSTAPGYRLGQVVPDGQAVQLPEGATAMFLFATGRTLRVRGPFEGDLDKAPEKEARAGSSGLLGSERFMQSDLGAARAMGNPLDKAVERAFAIDPAVSGTYCIKAGSPPMLRRPAEPGLTQIVLQDGRGASAKVTWAGAGTGAASAPWPRELALADGTEIRVSAPDGTPRTALRFRQVDATSGSAALAVRMAAAGCAGQAGAVLASLRDAVAPLDLYLSTDRGPAATYRAGEEVRLMLQTNRDAHVYCFLRNARAQLIPIFPSGLTKTALVEGNAPQSLPDERSPLRAGEPPGDVEVRCLAANRSLDGEMPGRTEVFRPLDDAAVAKLDRTLARLRDVELASAQIVLRVR